MYMQTENYGHYCCLNKISDKKIEFFNLYGLYPDKQFKFTDYNINKKIKQNHTYLSWLMYKSPYKLSFNHHKFQTKTPPVQTCGFHCANRIKYKKLKLNVYKDVADQSVKLLKKNGLTSANYDDWVVVNIYDEVF